MEDKIFTLAKTLLKDNLSDFETAIDDRRQLVNLAFLKKYRKLLEKFINIEYYVENNITIEEITVLLGFLKSKQLIFSVDWSGEEYPGQVKRSISTILKQFKKTIKWKNKKIHDHILSLNPHRGNFLPLLFKELNGDLNKYNLNIFFIDTGDDAYHFSVISNEGFKSINGLEDITYKVIDTKIYDLFLTNRGANSAKVIYLIKKKLQISFSDIKEMIQLKDILIQSGDRSCINTMKRQLEELGASVTIKEK